MERELFRKVTGLTWDINELINAAKGDADKSALLLKKLDWYIPEGAYLEGSEKRDNAVELINDVTTELNVELSEVFVDVDGDGDVDAYDVIDAKEPPTEGSIVFSADDLNVPIIKSRITLSSSNMTYDPANKMLTAPNSGRTFKITASGVQITEIDLETNTTGIRYKQENITDDSGLSVSTSCVRDTKSSYIILINDATVVNCKNNGGGVSILTITVKYKRVS